MFNNMKCIDQQFASAFESIANVSKNLDDVVLL